MLQLYSKQCQLFLTCDNMMPASYCVIIYDTSHWDIILVNPYFRSMEVHVCERTNIKMSAKKSRSLNV